jgi:hypothetical protein
MLSWRAARTVLWPDFHYIFSFGARGFSVNSFTDGQSRNDKADKVSSGYNRRGSKDSQLR